MGDRTESEEEAGNCGWMGAQRERRASTSFGNIRVYLITGKNLPKFNKKGTTILQRGRRHPKDSMDRFMRHASNVILITLGL